LLKLISFIKFLNTPTERVVEKLAICLSKTFQMLIARFLNWFKSRLVAARDLVSLYAFPLIKIIEALYNKL